MMMLENFNSYKKSLMIVLTGLMVAGGAVGGYRWYAVNREKNAHKAFTDCLYSYEKAQVNPQLWPQVELAFKAGHHLHASSSLAPYFLMYQADIMLKQDKKDEALVVMDQAMAQLPKSSPVYSLYQIKHALLRMDVPATKDAGLQELQKLAADTKNMYKDMAHYYVGLYHWSNDDVQQAKTVWQELVAQHPADATVASNQRSPWAALVEDKLNQIV